MLLCSLLSLALAEAPELPSIPDDRHLDHAEVGATVAAGASEYVGLYGGWDGRLRLVGRAELWPGPTPSERFAFQSLGVAGDGGFLHLRGEVEAGGDVVRGLRVALTSELEGTPGLGRFLADSELTPDRWGVVRMGPRIAVGPQVGGLWVRGVVDAALPVAFIAHTDAFPASLGDIRSRYRAYADLDWHAPSGLVVTGEVGMGLTSRVSSDPIERRPRAQPHLRLQVGWRI